MSEKNININIINISIMFIGYYSGNYRHTVSTSYSGCQLYVPTLVVVNL